MNIKRTLLLCLTLALCASLAICGTLAYLQDTDSDVNVMTLGSVYIKQLEQERSSTGSLRDFSSSLPIYPAVGEAGALVEGPVAGDAWTVYPATLLGVRDKFITVENTGRSDAYVRTIVAYEMPADAKVQLVKNDNASLANVISYEEIASVQLNGINHLIAVYTYLDPLAPKAITVPSLKQVYLPGAADNDDIAAYGNDGLKILAVSQAVQTAGFADAETALNEAFGDVYSDANGLNAELKTTLEALLTDSVVEEGSTDVSLNADKPTTLRGTSEPIVISGEGTLVLENTTIKAENGAAVTVAAGAKAKLNIAGSVSLTGGVNGSAIEVEEGATLEIFGNGTLIAIGNDGVEDIYNPGFNFGHGIGGKGKIYIHDLENLTAKGYGHSAAGIGGPTTEITIENTHIDAVKGGLPEHTLRANDSYAKNAAEGGPAIGNTVNGGVITLNNVVIEEAIGGGKSAGIGARYWNSTTVNINGCTINKVIGGTSAAAIGGSRVIGDTLLSKSQTTTINIHNSKIVAVGGDYGAGIGSGYDTHCTKPEFAPMCEINITGTSDITATGGKYAAGIGTGYHNGQLSGVIESSVKLSAASGEKLYKTKYTTAQDIGFGVIDPASDGLNNDCYIMVGDQKITIPFETVIPET